jgi:sialate O-acetylesterase
MLKTAMIFGSNMVLQRQKGFKIWGTGTPGETVTGILKGNERTASKAVIAESGNWELTFPSLEAGRGFELIITDGIETISYDNISIGEVWLAGGQSNMEYFLEYDAEKGDVLSGDMNPDIRFFDYPEVSYEGQLEEHDYSRFGIWRTCTKEDLPYFSAAGYYFAENLQNVLDIPIGIVGCNWGGTPASAWMDPEYLMDNEGKAWLESYEEGLKELDLEAYKAEYRANPLNDHSDPLSNNMMAKLMFPGFTREEQAELLKMMSGDQGTIALPQVGPYSEYRPGGMYEMMLKKVAPYSLRGVIWYQGESDEGKAELYKTVFSKMIECWRNLWDEQIPFLFVQLAPFGEFMGGNGNRYPELREQQELVSKTVPNTWMISSSDAGLEWDIHPKYKKPIGTRLALLARGHVYGENILCDPPEFLNAMRVSGGIRINFQNAEGLHLKGEKVNALVLKDTEGNELEPSKINVAEDGLLVIGEFPENVSVSFAKTGYYEVNLYNKEGNPAKPFEITI